MAQMQLMASNHCSAQPADAKWVVHHVDLQIVEMGKYAVDEHNKATQGNLEFVNVYEAWYMTLAKNSGHIYLLHITAKHKDDETQNHYQAFVRKKSCPAKDAKELMSFQILQCR